MKFEDKQKISVKEELDPENLKRKNINYEINIAHKIFYLKIGQHPELMNIFKILGFKLFQNTKLTLLKSEGNRSKIEERITILKQIQLFDTRSNYY